MKLRFDQNISYRVAIRLSSDFPDCAQVRQLGLEDKSDREIWEFAKKNEYSIVTFDADFRDFTTLYGHPPKVIWLRIGNTSTENLIALLHNISVELKTFISDKNHAAYGCLEIHQV